MPIWKENLSDSNVSLASNQVPFPDLIYRILKSRDFKFEQIENFLQPKLSSLKEPLALLGMKKACDRLVEAFLKNQKICIYADYDLDGTSGLAILKTGLERIGFQKVLFYQPKRLSEGYGFHPEAAEELFHLGVELIITVDVGITSFKAFEKARELGLDVILTDHHLPAETLPDAYVIVNPNQKDCQSGLGYLCGAGVAFYLLRALKRVFFENPVLPKNEWDLKEVLEFFCIGTLTDMVPLIEDNRVLVKHGLLVLAQTQKAGLKALLQELNLYGRQLSAQDVAIRFSPKLNALSRMESDILPAQIYLETNTQKAEQMIHQVLQNNQNRQFLQQDAEDKAMVQLADWQEPDFVFVNSEFFHRGVIGLIATKLSQVFNRPAFVGSQNSEGMIVGSSRVPSGSEVCLVQALNFAESVLNRHGGHSAAAGFELHNHKVNDFQQLLKQHFINLKSHPQSLEIQYDTVVKLSELNEQSMKWYDFLGPYGVGFPVPLLRINNLKIETLKELKGGHLKLTLKEVRSEASNILAMTALLFSPTSALKTLLADIDLKENIVDILGELQWNYFNGQKTIQLLIKDIKLL